MKKFSFALIAIIMVNVCSVAFAQDSILFNNDDINILKNILYETQNNIDILNWDFENPNNIKEAEWERINDECHLVSLDLSNLLINGDIDLSDCLYLEKCNFSNTDINSVQLPYSLKNISNKSFENCSKLQVATINADNTIIGSNAFSGCILLKGIVNADKITSIGRNAFNNCENLNFYFSENSSNSYIENYAQKYDFNIVNSVNTTSYGYAGQMYDNKLTKFDLNQVKSPYSSGSVSLYTLDKQLINTVNIDENGKFSLDNLTIGKKYRIVIDGKSAIPREEYFVPITQDYCIASNAECFGIIICDYNRDGVVNKNDTYIFLEALHHDSKDSNFDFSIYDFDSNGLCDAFDLACFFTLINIDYHNFDYS